jgi:hypothetical protein
VHRLISVIDRIRNERVVEGFGPCFLQERIRQGNSRNGAYLYECVRPLSDSQCSSRLSRRPVHRRRRHSY